MIQILALIVDYHTTSDAETLSLQLAESFRVHAQSIGGVVVHIDNGNPKPVTLSAAQKQFPSIHGLSTGKNLGYAGALHFAVNHCQKLGQNFDAYWFLNSDLEIEPDCLHRLAKVLESEPQVGALGPVVRHFMQKDRIWGARGVISPKWGITAMTDWPESGPLPKWSYIPGCSLLVRATAYTQVGGLPTLYQLYYEETDLCVQLQKANWQLWIEKTAIVYHKVDSMKSRIPARHFAYYFIRNNLFFWKKCFHISIWRQFPRLLWVTCKEILLPLRRSQSVQQLWDRLKYTGAGIIDGVLFAQGRPLIFEKKLFGDLHENTSRVDS